MTDSPDSNGSRDPGTPPTPVPVRKLMAEEGESAAPEPVRARAGEAPQEVGAPSEDPREVEVDGESWLVTLRGRARSARSEGSGVPLLLLTFAPSQDPDTPSREVLLVGKRLSLLSEFELEEAFRRSRPFVSD